MKKMTIASLAALAMILVAGAVPAQGRSDNAPQHPGKLDAGLHIKVDLVSVGGSGVTGFVELAQLGKGNGNGDGNGNGNGNGNATVTPMGMAMGERASMLLPRDCSRAPHTRFSPGVAAARPRAITSGTSPATAEGSTSSKAISILISAGSAASPYGSGRDSGRSWPARVLRQKHWLPP